MTPSQPDRQQTLFIEKGTQQYEVLVGLTPTDDMVVMGVRNAITHEGVDPSIIEEADIRGAFAALEWAFANDPDVVDGPQPVTRLFLEEADRHFEVVVGKTKDEKLVPLGIRNAISHNELRDDEMPDMSRFVEAVQLWAWAVREEGKPLTINVVDEDGTG